MAFRKVSYLIPSCDGCGLAWSFTDPSCPDAIPPHYVSRAAGLAQLPAAYGWQIVTQRVGRPLMACRRCAAAGVVPGTRLARSRLAITARLRRWLPSGPVLRPFPPDPAPGHPESLHAVLPPGQQQLLAAMDDGLFPEL